MNDPGLDDPISQNANAVEKERNESAAAEEDMAFLNPSRWWFASTAFPLLAGTFGPMASAFNLCALVEQWRVTIPPGGTEEHGDVVGDPTWLIAINAVSLVLAIIANVALLFNMARRLPFSIAQPITIIGWYMSAFILVGLIVAASYAPSMQLSHELDIALTQAYYYAIMSAGLYIIIATLMVFTVYGAYSGHYSKEFKLTMSQRTLMLQTIAYFIYLLSGAAVYAHLEDWKFLDAVYWANYTLLTIGTGDYSPMTDTGRGLLFPFAIGGIVILGLVIGSIRSLVLDRGKRKLSSRMIEKKREEVVDAIIETKSVKIHPLSKEHHLTPKGKPERKRREDEFELMRKIQDHIATKRKWVSLLVSATAWLFLWLVGAAVFYKAEKNQSWTYFNAVYFAYVSLLTIGFGDFRPMSNSGKPFFVFWSLLAIPTLTILISNMGNTVIKAIRDLTIWLGEFTVLPGEEGVRGRVKAGAEKLKSGKLTSSGGEETAEEAPGGVFLSQGNRRQHDEDPEKQQNSTKNNVGDRLAKGFGDEELDEAEIARRKGDKIGKDIHLYHYLLIKEIRNVMNDVNESPPRKYSYHEWAWFLRLMGEDENSPKYHRKPLGTEGTKAEHSPQIQQADPEDDSNNDDHKKWSWLGPRSPLMGDTEEAEWILSKLTETLEKELKTAREQQRRADPEMKAEIEAEGKSIESNAMSRESSRTLDREGSQEEQEKRKS